MFPNGRYNLENVAEDKPVAVGKRVDNRVGQVGERRLELMSSAGSEPGDLADGEARRHVDLIGSWGSPAWTELAAVNAVA